MWLLICKSLILRFSYDSVSSLVSSIRSLSQSFYVAFILDYERWSGRTSEVFLPSHLLWFKKPCWQQPSSIYRHRVQKGVCDVSIKCVPWDICSYTVLIMCVTISMSLVTELAKSETEELASWLGPWRRPVSSGVCPLGLLPGLLPGVLLKMETNTDVFQLYGDILH